MKISESKYKANKKYDKKTYERIGFDVRRDAEINGTYIREHAAARGESINSFIKRAIAETIKRDLADE